jgi:hypothetical protein
MSLFASSLSWVKIQRLQLVIACLRTNYISANANRSLNELQLRMNAKNSCLVGQDLAMENFCGYSFNHPS